MIRHIITVVCLLALVVNEPSLAQGSSNQFSDSVDVKFLPEATIGLLSLNDTLATICQAGFGARGFLSNNLSIAMTFGVGFVHYDSVWQAYFNVAMNFEWFLIEHYSNPRVSLLGSIGYGRIDASVNTTFQTLAGCDFRYDLTSERGSQHLRADVVAIVGYGVDWSQSTDAPFLNIGFAIRDLLTVTFDVSSLLIKKDAYIHVGRLR